MSQWIARLTRLHFIILVAALATFVTTFSYLQSLDEETAIAIVTSDINAGERITTSDLKYVEVSKDEKLEDYFFTEDQLKTKNLVAKIDLIANEFLNRSNTIRAVDSIGLQSMSLGVELKNANGGNIKRGDTVDIWQTGEYAKLVASQISVRKIVEPDKRLGVSTSQTFTLVLAVSPSQASALSKIVSSKDVMIVLSNGTYSTENPDTPRNENSNPFESIDLKVSDEG